VKAVSRLGKTCVRFQVYLRIMDDNLPRTSDAADASAPGELQDEALDAVVGGMPLPPQGEPVEFLGMNL
jgi:hypothetical protein